MSVSSSNEVEGAAVETKGVVDNIFDRRVEKPEGDWKNLLFSSSKFVV